MICYTYYHKVLFISDKVLLCARDSLLNLFFAFCLNLLFNVLCYIKTTGLSCTLNEPFSMHDFVTSCFDHFKTIGSLSYSDLPNDDTLHYTISKINHIN